MGTINLFVWMLKYGYVFIDVGGVYQQRCQKDPRNSHQIKD